MKSKAPYGIRRLHEAHNYDMRRLHEAHNYDMKSKDAYGGQPLRNLDFL